MFSSIRSRLIVIALLIVGSIYFLFPRTVTLRVRGADGVMHDDTVTGCRSSAGSTSRAACTSRSSWTSRSRSRPIPKKDLDLALTVLRKRIDEFGVEEPLVQKAGDNRIVVELAGITDPARAKAIVQRSAFLEFRITDKTSALEKALPAMDRALRGLGRQGRHRRAASRPPWSSSSAATRPAKAARHAEGATRRQGRRADSAKADSARRHTPVAGGVLGSLIQAGAVAGTATPGEYAVPETAFPRVDSLINLPAVARQLPRGVVLRWSAAPTSVGVQPYRYLYALDDRPIVTGSNLEDASAQLDPLTNGPDRHLPARPRRRPEVRRGDRQHVGDYMAIVLDGRVQGRPPVIQSRIGRERPDHAGQQEPAGGAGPGARAQGRRAAGAAQDRRGAAGRRQPRQRLDPQRHHRRRRRHRAGGPDHARYYRLSGVARGRGARRSTCCSRSAGCRFDATLTLPGLAGIVLSVGIAVDANVLIFERIREELMHGKTVRLAIDEGFQHAMTAIIDSNVTTVLTALFLFQFGTGPVKGFAVTLIIGIVASMITAVFVTRTFFMIWLQPPARPCHAEHLTCCDSSPTPTTTSSRSGAYAYARHGAVHRPGAASGSLVTG